MDTAVAVHKAASAMALVLAVLAAMARDDPEALGALAMVCADPIVLATALLMAALSMPDAAERRN